MADARGSMDFLSWFWAPICAVGAHGAGRVNAQISVSIFGASAVPERPRLLVVLYRPNYTRDLVEQSGTLAVTVLSTAQMELVLPLGTRSGRDGDKLARLEVELTAPGDAYFPAGIGMVSCEVIESFDLGEATAFLCAVRESRALRSGASFSTADVREQLATPCRALGMRSAQENCRPDDALEARPVSGEDDVVAEEPLSVVNCSMVSVFRQPCPPSYTWYLVWDAPCLERSNDTVALLAGHDTVDGALEDGDGIDDFRRMEDR
jgi:flavin reductase (DIM6/NTAB) family NADH-FMN oxidoreductase RutF